MKFDDFKQEVEGWARVRGIYDQSTEAKQVEKFKEEHWEYITSRDIDEDCDAIGDMAVCIVNAAYLSARQNLILGDQYCGALDDVCLAVHNRHYNQAINALDDFCGNNEYSFEDCLEMAWNEIKDRKGMMIDGLFVKWENLTTEQQEELQERLDSHIEADC